MPLAGFMVAQAELNFVYVILSGLVGFLLSVLPWYFAGRFLGEKGIRQLLYRHRRWLIVSTDSLDRVNAWFKRRGGLAVFFALLIPGVRNIISIPAGISGMPFSSFLLFSTVGATLWLIILTLAGYFLGSRYYLIDQYVRQHVGSVYTIVILVLLIAILIQVVRHYFKSKPRGRI